MSKNNNGPKILILDIETSLMKVWTFGIRDQFLTPSQIIQDSFILSCAAKWYEDTSGNVYGSHKKVMYVSHNNKSNPTKEDPKMLKQIWNLIDEADIILGQNSKKFDVKRLNTAFKKVGLHKPSSFQQIDTLNIASRNFGFTSNKLEYTSELLNKKYKKLKHSKFPGLDLWTECMTGNKEAWKELEIYNKHDVLATEEYYQEIQAWDNNSINFNIYHDDYHHICSCGSKDLKRNGYAYTSTGKYVRYKCKACGKESRDAKNLLIKEKRDSLKRKV